MELQTFTAMLLFLTAVVLIFLTVYIYKLTMFIIGQEDKYNGILENPDKVQKEKILTRIKNLTYKIRPVPGAVNIEPETVEQEKKRLNYEQMNETEKRYFDAGYDPSKVTPVFRESTKEKFKQLFKGKVS